MENEGRPLGFTLSNHSRNLGVSAMQHLNFGAF